MASLSSAAYRPAESALIVGGGIIGLSVAWELQRRGLRCTLVEADRIGRGASWAGAGVLPPARFDTALDPIDKLRGLSHQLQPEWAERLRTRTGIDPQFQATGGIYLARTAGEAAALVGQAAYWQQYEIECEPLSSDDLKRRAPALTPTIDSGVIRTAWWTPHECQMHPAEHLRALAAACRLEGVQLKEATPITRLLIEQNDVRGVETIKAEPLRADHVVLCCGAWASQFVDPRGAVSDVYPVRGQVVLYRTSPQRLGCIVNEGNRYLVPRLDGHLYVGSNEEEVGWQDGTTPAVIADLRGWAESLMPELATAEIRATWSGLRPGSFDTFPYIGRSPKYPHLYLATGHFRSGLHLSCGTAQLLGELITDQPLSMSLEPFRAGRSTESTC